MAALGSRSRIIQSRASKTLAGGDVATRVQLSTRYLLRLGPAARDRLSPDSTYEISVPLPSKLHAHISLGNAGRQWQAGRQAGGTPAQDRQIRTEGYAGLACGLQLLHGVPGGPLPALRALQRRYAAAPSGGLHFSAAEDSIPLGRLRLRWPCPDRVQYRG